MKSSFDYQPLSSSDFSMNEPIHRFYEWKYNNLIKDANNIGK